MGFKGKRAKKLRHALSSCDVVYRQLPKGRASALRELKRNQRRSQQSQELQAKPLQFVDTDDAEIEGATALEMEQEAVETALDASTFAATSVDAVTLAASEAHSSTDGVHEAAAESCCEDRRLKGAVKNFRRERQRSRLFQVAVSSFYSTYVPGTSRKEILEENDAAQFTGGQTKEDSEAHRRLSVTSRDTSEVPTVDDPASAATTRSQAMERKEMGLRHEEELVPAIPEHRERVRLDRKFSSENLDILPVSLEVVRRQAEPVSRHLEALPLPERNAAILQRENETDPIAAFSDRSEPTSRREFSTSPITRDPRCAPIGVAAMPHIARMRSYGTKTDVETERNASSHDSGAFRQQQTASLAQSDRWKESSSATHAFCRRWSEPRKHERKDSNPVGRCTELSLSGSPSARNHHISQTVASERRWRRVSDRGYQGRKRHHEDCVDELDNRSEAAYLEQNSNNERPLGKKRPDENNDVRQRRNQNCQGQNPESIVTSVDTIESLEDISWNSKVEQSGTTDSPLISSAHESTKLPTNRDELQIRNHNNFANEMESPLPSATNYYQRPVTHCGINFLQTSTVEKTMSQTESTISRSRRGATPMSHAEERALESMYGTGFSMLRSMGYAGGAIGKRKEGVIAPIETKQRDGRVGLGWTNPQFFALDVNAEGSAICKQGIPMCLSDKERSLALNRHAEKRFAEERSREKGEKMTRGREGRGSSVHINGRQLSPKAEGRKRSERRGGRRWDPRRDGPRPVANAVLAWKGVRESGGSTSSLFGRLMEQAKEQRAKEENKGDARDIADGTEVPASDTSSRDNAWRKWMKEFEDRKADKLKKNLEQQETNMQQGASMMAPASILWERGQTIKPRNE